MNNQTELVQFNVNPPQINIPKTEIDKDSLKLRDSLLATARGLKPITDQSSSEIAIACGVEIRRVIKSAEARFAELKRPVLDYGTALKAILDAFIAPLKAEQERLERQATVWRQEENRQIEAKLEKQRLEIQKAQEEAAALSRKAQEASEAVRGPKSFAKAVQAQEQANAAQETVMTALTAPVPTVQKTKGTAFRTKLRFRVTNISDVYHSNPMLCKPLEIRLAAVNLLVPAKGATSENPDRSIPGIETWMEAETSFRA